MVYFPPSGEVKSITGTVGDILTLASPGVAADSGTAIANLAPTFNPTFSGILTNETALINPGNAILFTGTKGLEKVTYRSPIFSYTALGTYPMLTVPTGFVFLPDMYTVCSLLVTGSGIAPAVSITDTNSVIYLSYQTSANIMTTGATNKIIQSNGLISAATELEANVTIASGASLHTGFILVSGYMIPTT